jgi:hypothetical protein
VSPDQSLDPITALPGSVRDMVHGLGMGPTMALVRAVGGTTLRVPTGARSDGILLCRLIEILGEAGARALVASHGGERLFVPRCAQALRDARDYRIIEAYSSGTPVQALARAHLLTERQIWSILKRDLSAHAAGGLVAPQGTLF